MFCPLAPFDPVSDPSSLSQRWKAWKRRFETYLVATNVTADKQKRALLLYQAGEETQDLFDTLTDTGTDYATALTKLDAYFTPKKNVDYEIFQFRQAVQKEGETIDQFVTRLRKVAATCEFADLDKELKAAVIQHCQSKQLRRYALREDDLTLDKLLSKARALEASERQASGMESLNSEKMNRIRQQNKAGNGKFHFKKHPPTPPKQEATQCRKCGHNWPHVDSPCPATGKECRKCGKPNHFARMCKSTKRGTQPSQRNGYSKPRSQVNQITAEAQRCSSSDDDEYLFTVGQDGVNQKVPEITVSVCGVPVRMTIDTGASTNIVDEVTFAKVTEMAPVELKPPSARIFAYGSQSQLSVHGKFEAVVEVKNKSVEATVHVVQGAHGSLLSYKTALALGVVDIKINAVTDVKQVAEKYPELFDGIGTLKNYEVKLHIDESVPPVAQRPRKIPFHLRVKVAAELEKLENEGIIEKVDGPTPWISPLVVTPKKNGEIRLCVDMHANG